MSRLRPAPLRLLAAALATALSLSACSVVDTMQEGAARALDAVKGQAEEVEDLETIVAGAQEYIDEQLAGDELGGIYRKIRIKAVPPNGVEYVYVFKRAVPPKGVAAMEKNMPALRKEARRTVLPDMEEGGITDPTVTFTFLNPDGSTVLTRTFESQ